MNILASVLISMWLMFGTVGWLTVMNRYGVWDKASASDYAMLPLSMLIGPCAFIIAARP